MSETGNEEEVGKKLTKTAEEQSQPKKESLKDAVIAVLQGKSLAAHEILDALRKRGYKFSPKREQIVGDDEANERPINVVRVFLYTQKKLLNNTKGIFSLKDAPAQEEAPKELPSGRTKHDESRVINFEKIEDYFNGKFDTKEQNRYEFQADPKWKPMKFGIFEKLESEPYISKAIEIIKEYYSIHNRLPILANSAVDAADGLVWGINANQDPHEWNQKVHESETFELELGFYDSVDFAIKGLTQNNSSLINCSEDLLGLYYDIMDLNTGIRYLGDEGERRLISSCWPIYSDHPEGCENLALPESGETIYSLFTYSEKGYCPRNLFNTYTNKVLSS